VRVGVWSSAIVLVIAIVLGGFIGRLSGSLFVYIQSLYAFFAPPFAAAFLLGNLRKRINGSGALAAVVLGFAFGILMKVYVQFDANIQAWLPLVPDHPAWLAPYANQAAINWCFCVVVCVAVSLATPPPRPEQVTDQVTVNWRKLNIFDNLGTHWYTSVLTWWLLFVLAIVTLLAIFSGFVFPSGVAG
jgi:SSS family solute:Na+ symporter